MKEREKPLKSLETGVKVTKVLGKHVYEASKPALRLMAQEIVSNWYRKRGKF